jgi:hypothetical protein
MEQGHAVHRELGVVQDSPDRQALLDGRVAVGLDGTGCIADPCVGFVRDDRASVG